MLVNTFIGNIFSTNTYLVRSKGSHEFLCVDPSYGTSQNVLKILHKEKGILRFIINTHAHFDHIAEDLYLREQTGALILMSELDKEALAMQNQLLSKVKLMLSGSEETKQLIPLEYFEPDRFLKEGDMVKINNLSFVVIGTPGHTEGSCSLYCGKEKALFTGDTLFAGTHGRTDLPHSDEKKIKESLKKLALLPKDTVVYPGHDQATTIEQEKVWIDRLT